MQRAYGETACRQRHYYATAHCLPTEDDPSVPKRNKFRVLFLFTVKVRVMGPVTAGKAGAQLSGYLPLPACKFTLFRCYLATHNWYFPITMVKCLQKLTKTLHKLCVLCMKNRIFATVFSGWLPHISTTYVQRLPQSQNRQNNKIQPEPTLLSCKKQQTHTAILL